MQPVVRHQGRLHDGLGSPPSELAACPWGCQREQDAGLAPLAAGVDVHTWALCCREERGCTRGNRTPGTPRAGAVLGTAKLLEPPRYEPRGSLGHSLQKARLVLLLVVRPELDLALVAGKLAGFVKGDRVGTVKDVVASLRGKRRHRCGLGSHAALPPLPSTPSRTCFPDLKEMALKKRRT